MADSLGQMPFGAFKGVDIEDIPNKYLEFIIGEKWFITREASLAENIKKELKYRKQWDINIEWEKN
uniref:Putative quorum-sensing-regulated virulence factor n=1 Tax=viral metagenome TaxID=1070528 RepID=A0A6M3JQ67_9ZZZZ